MGSNSETSNAKIKRGRNEGIEVRHEQNQILDSSFSDLPRSLMENIISRLSVKRIAMSKCVCKTWYELISDPDFAKLHLDRSEICPLLRSSRATFLSRLLYLVHEENLGYIDRIIYNCSIDVTFGRCRDKVKIDTKLRVPLRNFENIPNNEAGGSNNWIKLKMKDHNYMVVNSCNGLLCLSKPYDSDPVIVSNPVTGEYINLPEDRVVKYPESYNLEFRHITSGFGFSPRTNQYKVIRMFMNYNTRIRSREPVAEIHVLGTKSWKGIGRAHHSMDTSFPTSLNGFLYWLSDYFVTSFDIDKECFGKIPFPPLTRHANVGIGVLGRDLCITVVAVNDFIVWAMKDNNDCDASWSKLFSFPEFSSYRFLPYGSLQPIKCINDRGLLMFNSRLSGFIYMDPTKVGYKFIRVRGIDSQIEAIVHRPSFVKLNDVLAGNDVGILNVNSRCGALKLHNESKFVCLLEDDH